LRPVSGAVTEDSGRTLAFVVGVLEAFLRRTTRVEWRGLEHIPRTGGVIIAANHVSHYDPLVMGHFVVAAGRWPRYLGKESLFRIPLLGRLITACEQIPVHRGSARAIDALREAAAAVTAGKAIIIYPEGTISKERQMWPMIARSGMIRLAMETGVPIVPVAQWGAQQVMPTGRSFPRFLPPKLMQFTAGLPIDLSDLVDDSVTAEALAIGGERVMAAITAMLAEIRQLEPPKGRWDDKRKAYVDPVERFR
ncbi:MAG: 1-acyl-sn-glycerol-3-phosphate acyltransferase, partial [Propionibacteriales bacterium]|nr:1-acyl-sn-glycerol-3-phosphate acyltransferase [Propionibacteriales bacterium]